MTVQYTQTPCRQHEQSGAGKENLNETNCQGARGRIEAIRKKIDEIWSGQNSDQHDHRSDEDQQGEDGVGNTSCFLLVPAGEQLRIDGDERRRQRAFTEDILEEVRNSERGTERAGGIGRAEVMSKDALPDDANNATDQNAHSDQQG